MRPEIVREYLEISCALAGQLTCFELQFELFMTTGILPLNKTFERSRYRNSSTLTVGQYQYFKDNVCFDFDDWGAMVKAWPIKRHEKSNCTAEI